MPETQEHPLNRVLLDGWGTSMSVPQDSPPASIPPEKPVSARAKRAAERAARSASRESSPRANRAGGDAPAAPASLALALTPVVEVDASEVEVVDVVPGGSGAAGARASGATGHRLSRMNSHFKECGFDSGKAVAEAREDTIIAAVSEDSKQDTPAYLADKKLGAPTGGLETVWTRVQALVDAADAKRDVKLWPGGCLDWRSLRDRFFQIMENFTKEAPTKTGDRGEHTQTTDATSERYLLLGRMRCAWEDKKKAFKNMQEANTADRQADAEQAAKRRDFVKKAASSRRNLGGAMDDASERRRLRR